MADEKDVFYVVKKGNVVGIYKSFNDIQTLLSSSVSGGESVSVFKGFSLPQETEEYLVSHGLKGATYSISAANVNAGSFGRLVACPYQDPYSSEGGTVTANSLSKSSQGALQVDASDTYSYGGKTNMVNCSSKSSLVDDDITDLELEAIARAESLLLSKQKGGASSSFSASLQTNHYIGGLQLQPELSTNTCKSGGSSSFSTSSQKNHHISGLQLQPELSTNTCLSCTLEFDGASKNNPGPAGAGAILRADDGSKVYRLREGLGNNTNNVAEYRALILGLKQAIKKGYKHISVQGDSMLVCNQIQGIWKVKNENIGYLCNEAKKLKDKFLSFKINHILREFNSEADAQANRAVYLKDGQVEEDCEINVHN